MKYLSLLALIAAMAVMTGCSTTARQTDIREQTPSGTMVNRSFTGTKGFLVWQKDLSTNSVVTNEAGHSYEDHSTSYRSGFHMPGAGLFSGFCGIVKDCFAVPTGIVIESYGTGCAYPVTGGTYYVGGYCGPQSFPRVATTVGPNSPRFEGYGLEHNGR